MLARGDRVVLEESAAVFFEGLVVGVTDSAVKVDYRNGNGQSGTRVVPLSDVYRLPGTSGQGELGYAVCGAPAGRWLPCKVRGQEGAWFDVEPLGQPSLVLAADKVLRPTALTELNVKRRFEQAAAQREFLAAWRACSPPVVPPSWRPRPHERVVVRAGSQWYSARVHELEDDGVRVIWRGEERPAKVAYSDVRSEPPSEHPPEMGSYALIRPASDVAPWTPVRVLSVDLEVVRVADAAGTKRIASRRDLLPFVRPSRERRGASFPVP